PIGRAATTQTHGDVVRNLERHRRRRQLLHDLGKLSRRYRDRALGADLRRHRDARADLEVRRGQAHAIAGGLEQDVRENRERLPWLDDVLNHLEAFEERVTLNHYFHEVLQCCFEEERNNFVAVVIVKRGGQRESAKSADNAVSSATTPTGISVWRSWRALWITG